MENELFKQPCIECMVERGKKRRIMLGLMPYIKFPEDLIIQLIPCHNYLEYALQLHCTTEKLLPKITQYNCNKYTVSAVYDLDGKATIDKNCWEIHPGVDGEIARFLNTKEGIEKMFDAIRASLMKMEKRLDAMLSLGVDE